MLFGILLVGFTIGSVTTLGLIKLDERKARLELERELRNMLIDGDV